MQSLAHLIFSVVIIIIIACVIGERCLVQYSTVLKLHSRDVHILLAGSSGLHGDLLLVPFMYLLC